MAASVRTRVVSWNDAAEMKDSVDRDAFCYPKHHRVKTYRDLSFCFDTVILFMEEQPDQPVLHGGRRYPQAL
jgi:hypothetical protein